MRTYASLVAVRFLFYSSPTSFQVQGKIREGQSITMTSPYSDKDYIISPKLIADLKNHDILSQNQLDIKCPVHLLHGMQDEVVPYAVSVEVAEKLCTRDVQLVLSKAGQHQFSQTADIQLLFETLELLVHGLRDVRELAIQSWSSFSLFPQPDHLITKRKVLKKY